MEYLEELWHTKQDGESDCRRFTRASNAQLLTGVKHQTGLRSSPALFSSKLNDLHE